jgi:hypothetical protein
MYSFTYENEAIVQIIFFDVMRFGVYLYVKMYANFDFPKK